MLRTRWLLAGALILIGGCATTPPSNMDDSCAIFREKGGWYDATRKVYKRWGVPPHIQLAIIHQESRFKYDAKPPRKYLLWVIPWGRQSSAYGYAQAQDSTWDWYREKTGNWRANRDDFEDAIDFIGWYVNVTHRTLGISKWDGYHQYLAYHEGHGGYQRRTYLKKPWLMKVAQGVKVRSQRYHTQLSRCKEDLESGWSLWPF